MKENKDSYGIIIQKNGKYGIRILTNYGYVNCKEMEIILNIAKQYKKDEISITSRGTIEIFGLEEYEVLEIKKFLLKNNIKIGGTGKKVRAIQVCKSRECKYGIINPIKIAKELEEIGKDYEFVNKFKIGIFGCKNSTGKALSSDFAIIPVSKNEQKIYFNIFLGGRMGKKERLGKKLPMIYSLDEVKNILEKILILYKNNGKNNERFSDVIERIGFEKIKSEIKMVK